MILKSSCLAVVFSLGCSATQPPEATPTPDSQVDPSAAPTKNAPVDPTIAMAPRGPDAPRRPLSELVATTDLGIDRIRQLAAEAKNKVEIMPPDEAQRGPTLEALQVTNHSPLGALAYDTGGIVIDDGFLRIFGSGSLRVPQNVSQWNGRMPAGSKHRLNDALIVAVDVLGGFFALNIGAFPGGRNIFYLAPDDLVWDDLQLQLGEFLALAIKGDLELFYKGFRWSDWRKDVATLKGDQGYSYFPPLWSKEGGITTSTRGVVPIDELWISTQEARQSLGIK